MERREFLKKAGLATFSLLAISSMGKSALNSAQAAPPPPSRCFIDPDTCVSCGACADICPTEAIFEGDDHYIVNTSKCTGCKTCINECPVEAIEVGSYIAEPGG